MKLVIAYIQPYKLDDVKQALFDSGITKMSVMTALGCGQQMGYEENYRGTPFTVNLLKKVRIEVAVNQEFEAKAVDAIVAGAKTGNIGDGKIFVLDLTECVRIRTNEKGNVAIG